MTAPSAPGATPGAPRLGVLGRFLVVVAAIASRLPERPLVAAADGAGEIWYRVAPARRAQARANLRRVCEHLAASGRGSGLARRAAADPAALERLVHRCFRHAARYYLEVARTAGYRAADIVARLDLETPEVVADALDAGRPIMLIGMHFGSIEVPVVFVSHRSGKLFTGPMETLADPGLHRWFVETRSRVGVRIVPIAAARRAMLEAVERGDPVGMVADRDLTGGGIKVDYFGHPASFPIGPALMAIEADLPLYVAAARRTKDLRYLGRMLRVPEPGPGTRRERVTELTTGMVRAFENLLADAPEQWWGAFHVIWPDLVVGEAGHVRAARGGRDAGQAAP
jgi:KDO2-lipid IV(A) lauroyltransferase